MRVKATQTGYYGDILRYGPMAGVKEGDVFDLVPYQVKDRKTGKMVTITAEMQFSHEWMERVDSGPVPTKKRVMPDDIVPPPPPASVLKRPSQPGNFNPPPATTIPSESDDPTGSQDVI